MTAVDILYPTSQAMELLQSQGRERPVESSRYLCKICSKGFVSGRALGGHMRAHLPACMPADQFIETEFRKSKRPRVSNDQSMEEKDDEEGFDGNGANLIFALRRNPKRTWKSAYWDDSFLLEQGLDSDSIDSCLDCDLCGKEFSSWKGLYGHMNCCCETHQDGGDASLEESHKHETQDKEDKIGDSNSEIEMEIDQPSGNLRRFDKCVKEKRFKRPRYVLQRNPHEQFASVINDEEEDMALCLVMLANGVNTPQNQVGVADPESGHLKPPNNGSQLPKSIGKKVKYKKINGDARLYDDDDEDKKGKYKCTTCNKIFHSYQALGGHRARHAKVKRCFTQIEDEQESLEEEITDDELNTGSGSQLPGNFHKPHSKESTKVSGGKARDGTRTIEFAAISDKKIPRIHECSICKKGFASGQALGGHKRCHWGSGASDTTITSCGNKETAMLQQLPARVELLDLNMPAPFDDDGDAGDLNTLDGNAVDSHGTSYAQTHYPPSLLPLLMSNHPRQGLFLYNSDADLSKDDEADGKVGKDIRFGRWSDSEFPVRAQTWLQL